MKRLISLVVIAVMLVTAMPMVMAEEYTVDEGYEQKLELFTSLGIIDTNTSADKKVSRAEFVRYVVRLANRTEGYGAEDNVFWDVTPENEYYSDIVSAKKNGFVNGNEDGSFSPYANITRVQALSILVNVLGYDEYAKHKGAYPTGMFTVANEIGLTGTIKSDNEPLTFADMLNIFFKAIDIPLCENELYGIDYNTYRRSAYTILEKYHDIYKISGIMNDNSVTSLNNPTTKPRSTIKIGDKNIYGVPKLADELIGYNVYCYAKYENDMYTCLYIMPNHKNTVTEVMLEKVTAKSLTSIKYLNENDREREMKLNANMKYTYNGSYVDFSKYSFNDIFNGRYGKVIFIDNNSDGDYDVVNIYSYQTIALKYLDTDAEILFDMNSPKNNADLSKLKHYEIFDANGNELEQPPLGSVVTLMMDLDKTYAKLICSQKTITGRISEVDTENNLTINGVSYTATDELVAYADPSMITVGAGGTFYLDINNRIAYVGAEAESDIAVAYLVVAGRNGELSDNLIAKLFTKAGEYELHNISPKVKIDGKVYKKASDILTQLNGGGSSFTPIPIAYKVNADGYITYIDTPVKTPVIEDDTTLVQRHKRADGGLFYKGSSNVNYRKVWGGRYISGDDDFVVGIDPNTQDWEDLSVVTSLKDDESYPVDVYSFSEDSPFGNIVLVEGKSNASVTNDVYIFDSMREKIDESEKYGSLIEVKCYWKAGVETTLTATPDSQKVFVGGNVISEASKTNITAAQATACEGLKPGDMFRVALDSKGFVIKVEKLYDYENKLFLNPVENAANPNQNSAFEGNSSSRLLVGNVYSMTNGYARFSTNEIVLTDPQLDEKLESIYGAGNMYQVDERDNIKFTKITTGEQILGKKYGEDIKIFVKAEYTRPQYVYYIKY